MGLVLSPPDPPDKKKRGRPPKDTAERLDVDLRLQVSPALYERICQIAMRANIPPYVLVRKLLEREAERLSKLLSP